MKFHGNGPQGITRKVSAIAAFLFAFIFSATVGVARAATDDSSRVQTFAALNRSGLDHYYSLEYDEAIRDFQKAADLYPDDPQVWNHLLEALLFHELYKHDALDTSLYTHHTFLNTRQVPADAATNPLRFDRRTCPLGIGFVGALPDKTGWWPYEPPYAPGITIWIHDGPPDGPLVFANEATPEMIARYTPANRLAKTPELMNPYAIRDLRVRLADLRFVRKELHTGWTDLSQSRRRGVEYRGVGCATTHRQKRREGEAFHRIHRCVG